MKFHVAINLRFVGKMERGDKGWKEFNNSFASVETDAVGLANAIHAGHAHCACHSHVSHRKEARREDGTKFMYDGAYRDILNFTGMQTACLDFDGMKPEDSIQALLSDPLIDKRAALLYSTSSSKPEAPRTRVVFILERILTDPDEARLFSKALTSSYQRADKSGSDVMKAWSGSLNCDMYLNEEAYIPHRIVEGIIATARRAEEEYKERQRQYLDGVGHDKMKEKLRAALKFVPQHMDYNDWLKALMAAYSVFPDETGVAIIEEWSPGYGSGPTSEVARKFTMFRDVRISPSWIFAVAYNRGWRDPDGTSADYGDIIDWILKERGNDSNASETRDKQGED